ncbi:MAG: glycosyltransferase [Sedimentisphaerales bacterium]|nr:glycosyltransferase [Sedimentisphaerales bacterium]
MSNGNTNNPAYNVSVIMPAYNAEKTLARAIASITSQTCKPQEIIVIDDGSTDNTAGIAKKYDSVKYISRQNAGPSAARNTGIQSALGEWIAFLDADDQWLPEYLEKQTKILRNNPDLVWTTANYYQCLREKGVKEPFVEPKKINNLLQGKDYFDNFFFAFKKHCRGCTDTMLIKKDILSKIGLFNTERNLSEDIELWFKIAFQFPMIGFNAEPIAIYNMDTSQSLTTKNASDSEYIEFVKQLNELARKYNKAGDFKPIVAEKTSLRIRSLLFENRPDRIKLLISELGHLLNPAFKLLINLLMICPGLTAYVCHFISKVVRKLKLRSQIIPPPNKPKK